MITAASFVVFTLESEDDDIEYDQFRRAGENVSKIFSYTNATLANVGMHQLL